MKMVRHTKWALKGESEKTALNGAQGLGKGVNSSHKAPSLLHTTQCNCRGAQRTICSIEPHDISISASEYPLFLAFINCR